MAAPAANAGRLRQRSCNLPGRRNRWQGFRAVGERMLLWTKALLARVIFAFRHHD
ncbi:MAG: hypothetical protein ACR2NX_03980 [Chthoniobacterales bacterium]